MPEPLLHLAMEENPAKGSVPKEQEWQKEIIPLPNKAPSPTEIKRPANTALPVPPPAREAEANSVPTWRTDHSREELDVEIKRARISSSSTPEEIRSYFFSEPNQKEIDRLAYDWLVQLRDLRKKLYGPPAPEAASPGARYAAQTFKAAPPQSTATQSEELTGYLLSAPAQAGTGTSDSQPAEEPSPIDAEENFHLPPGDTPSAASEEVVTLDPRYGRIVTRSQWPDPIFEENLASARKVETALAEYRSFRTKRNERTFSYIGNLATTDRSISESDRIAYLAKLNSGITNMRDALSEKDRFLFDMQLSDRDEDKIRFANRLTVSSWTGLSIEEISKAWPYHMEKFAREHFGITDPLDERQFYAASGIVHKAMKEQNDLTTKVSDRARIAAIKGIPLEDGIKQALGFPHADPGTFIPVIRTSYANVYKDFSDEQIAVGRALWQFASTAQQGGNLETDVPLEHYFAAYGKMNRQDQDKVLALMAMQAEDEQWKVQGYLARLYDGLRAGWQSTSLGLLSFRDRNAAEDIDRIIARGTTTLGPEISPLAGNRQSAQDYLGAYRSSQRTFYDDPAISSTVGYAPPVKERPLTPSELHNLKNWSDQLKGSRAFFGDLANNPIRASRAIDEHRNGFWDSIDDWGVMALQSAPEMGLAIAPYGIGLPILLASREGRIRREIERYAVNASPEEIAALSWTTAGLQTLLDRVEVGIFAGKVPYFSKALEGQVNRMMSRGIISRLGGTIVDFGGKILSSGASDVIQNLTPAAVQELAAALSKDIAGPKWNEILENERQQLGDTFGTSMIFSIIFGAGSQITHYANQAKLREALTDSDGLALHGLNTPSIEAISALAKRDVAAAADLLRTETLATTPEQRRANSTAAKQRLQEQSRTVTSLDDAGFPAVEPQVDGTFTVAYPNGARATENFPSIEKARTAAADFVENRNLDLILANREMVERLKQTSDGTGPQLQADPSSPDSSFAIPPIGPGTRQIAEAPPVIPLQKNPFAETTAKTPSEWRPVWAAWLKKNRSTWLGEGPIMTDEGPIVLTNQTTDHIRHVRTGENAALHFEAATRIRELLTHSKLASVEAPKAGEKSAQEIHRRYAWMKFSDGETHHVLLTVKRWDESTNKNEDTAYALEALEVKEKGITDGNSPSALADSLADTGNAEGTIIPSSTEFKTGNESGSGNHPQNDLDRFRAGLKPEHRHPLDLTRANREMVEHLQGQSQGTGRQLQVAPSRFATLADWAAESGKNAKQARARVEIMLRQAGHDMGLAADVDLSTIPIYGMRWNTRNPDGTTTLHAELADKANPDDIIQEHAEGLAAWLLDEAHVSEETITGWLRHTEASTNSKFLHDDLGSLSPELRRQELLEAFGYVARSNALGQIPESNLPGPIRTFFRAFKEMLSQSLRIATDFRQLRDEGKVDPHFAHWLDIAAGLDPTTQGPLRPDESAPANPNANPPTDSSFAIPPIGPGKRQITKAPEVVKFGDNPFGDFTSLKKSEWLRVWKNWESTNRGAWRQTINLSEGPVTIGDRTAREVGAVKRLESLSHHFQAATMLPELLRNSVLASVEEPVGKPSAQEIHKRYAWMHFPDGERRNVLMTVIRWKGEQIDSDTAYSVEALEVQKEATTAKRELQTSTVAASAALGDGDNLAQFLAGIKPEHRHKSEQGTSPEVTFSIGPDSSSEDSPVRNNPSLISSSNASATPDRRSYTPSALDILEESKQAKGLHPQEPLAAFGEGRKFQDFLRADTPATKAEILEESGQLEEWAEANRRWIAPKTSKRLAEMAFDFDRGAEHDVLLFNANPESAFVVKMTYDGKFGKENRTPAAYLNRWALFNAAIPEAAAQFIGYTKDARGRGVIVMAQPFILGEKSDQAAITREMAAKGFELMEPNGTIYRNPETGVEIHDAHDDNVLFKPDGTMVPIDVWINDPKNFYKLRSE